MDLKFLKKEERKRLLSDRDTLTASALAEKNEAICQRLVALTEALQRSFREKTGRELQNIFSYAAVPGEADPALFDEWARKQGMKVAYPVTHRGGIMEAYEPSDAAAMPEGLYGIRAPKAEESVLFEPGEIDLMIVPCVGFDKAMRRLGHGGGYYDRYMEKLSPEALRIMIAYDIQEAEEIVTEDHDLTLPYIVTESRTLG